MKKLKIEIRELLSRIIEVEASSIDEAIKKVNQAYNSAEIVLDHNDLLRLEIIPNTLNDEKDDLTKEIIDYLYKTEERHFEELEKPINHIFLKLERLSALIN